MVLDTKYVMATPLYYCKQEGKFAISVQAILDQLVKITKCANGGVQHLFDYPTNIAFFN